MPGDATMGGRRVFESLCMEPGEGGFSYDRELLVDIDRAVDFDEAVIRLITKCNSIVTQLRSLGNTVAEFSVTSTMIGDASGTANRRNRGLTEDTHHHSPISSSNTSTPEERNVRALEDVWGGLKRKNYSGVVALARLSRSSIPRNGCGSRYSVKTLKEALLNHIQAYFMFQSYNPMFQPWTTPGKGKDKEGQGEYLLFLAYRIQPSPAITSTPKEKQPRRLSELDKLETTWHSAFLTPVKRKRQLSSGSSVSSSSSSVSSNPSDGTTRPSMSPSHHSSSSSLCAPVAEAVSPCSLFLSDVSKETDNYGFSWSEWAVSGRKGSLRSSSHGTPTSAAAPREALTRREAGGSPHSLRSGGHATRRARKMPPQRDLDPARKNT